MTRAEIDRAAGIAYVLKAEEFFAAALDCLRGGRYNAACSLAVHAGICSNDAYLAGRHGVRSTSRDHGEAVDLLEALGGTAVREHAKQLRGLLKRKTLAEYDDRPVTAVVATTAVERAERLVGWAKRGIPEAAG